MLTIIDFYSICKTAHQTLLHRKPSPAFSPPNVGSQHQFRPHWPEKKKKKKRFCPLNNNQKGGKHVDMMLTGPATCEIMSARYLNTTQLFYLFFYPAVEGRLGGEHLSLGVQQEGGREDGRWGSLHVQKVCNWLSREAWAPPQLGVHAPFPVTLAHSR